MFFDTRVEIFFYFCSSWKNNNWKENFYESPEVSLGDDICREWNAKTFCSISKLIQLQSHVIEWAWIYFAIWTNLMNKMCSNVDIFALTLFHLSVNLIFKAMFCTFFRQKFWILIKMKWKWNAWKKIKKRKFSWVSYRGITGFS
jgi:hypothetical protein